MAYLDEAGDTGVTESQIEDSTAAALPRHRSPVETEFTASEFDVSARQLPSSMPPPGELGLIRPSRAVPRRGWRGLLHRMTGGMINLGESAVESSDRKLVGRIRQPVRGTYSIAVLSLKGGVGKTTTTVGLGSTFASLRGDRVIAVDANPDFGTLAQRGANQTASTVRNLLADGRIARYSEIRRHTSQGASRLEILGSERDPAVSEAFSEADYRAVHKTLQRFYNIILTDCGTGLAHSAMRGVLDTADALVLVASPAIDSARSALATLDWLAHHGYADLVPHTTVVLSSARPGPIPIDLKQLTRHFRSRVGPVFAISYDRHLGEGGEISLDLTSGKTRRAYMDLAGAVADGFGRQSHS